MSSQFQEAPKQSSAQPEDSSLTKKKTGFGSKIMAVWAIFLFLLIVEYAVLVYLGNPVYMIIIFIMIIEISIFAVLFAHILAIMIRGLRVDGDYFVLPHPGLYALFNGGPKTIRFKDIDIAYVHQGRTEKRSQLRIKLSDGSAIALRRGDIGIRPGSFDALVKQIDMRHKLDTINFRS